MSIVSATAVVSTICACAVISTFILLSFRPSPHPLSFRPEPVREANQRSGETRVSRCGGSRCQTQNGGARISPFVKVRRGAHAAQVDFRILPAVSRHADYAQACPGADLHRDRALHLSRISAAQLDPYPGKRRQFLRHHADGRRERTRIRLQDNANRYLDYSL